MASTANFKCRTPLSAYLYSTRKQNKGFPDTKKVTWQREMAAVTTTTLRGLRGKNGNKGVKRNGVVRCSGIGLGDFIGGDLIKPDLGRWLSDVEEHKALAIYPPHEGGYEGRYLSRLKYQGYYFLDLSARGLGDPETTLTKIHPVCPVSFV